MRDGLGLRLEELANPREVALEQAGRGAAGAVADGALEAVEPSISSRTPVSSGSISSRPAAALACATAVANSSALIVPDDVGICGSCGYSSTGIVDRLNRALPHETWTLVPSRLTSIGFDGSDLTISDSRRPDTRARPSSATSAGSVARVEVS